MKAKSLLQYVNDLFPDIVAVAQDETGHVYFYTTTKLEFAVDAWFIQEEGEALKHNPLYNKDIEWDSNNWKECIETIEIKNKQNESN